jgi:hypothetical protein
LARLCVILEIEGVFMGGILERRGRHEANRRRDAAISDAMTANGENILA